MPDKSSRQTAWRAFCVDKKMTDSSIKLSLSTRWNAGRHSDGFAMIDEILSMGFRSVELGYDLRRDLVEGVRASIDSGTVRATSVHNFCPVPTAAPAGHPELFTLADKDPRVRAQAVRYTSETIRFAAEVGAKVVVLHAGNVAMKRITPKLFGLCEEGKKDSKQYEKLLMKLLAKREKRAPKQLAYLMEGLEKILPVLEENNITLGIENLPSWEGIPTELEMETILKRFDSPLLGYWHDMGHGEVRENIGLSSHLNWLQRLSPSLVGMHVHDVMPPAGDHLMPPKGEIDFSRFSTYAHGNIPLVLEPSPHVPKDELQSGAELLQEVWQ